MTPAEALLAELRPRLAARPLVLLLDVDGTLSPIAPTPETAIVPDATREALRRLAAAPGVHLAIVSGRAAHDALRLVGLTGIWALGNHGFEVLAPEGEYVSDPAVGPYRARLATAAAEVGELLRSHAGTQLEDKTWTLSVHYRRAAEGTGELLRGPLEDVAARQGLRLTAGKMVFELRPPIDVNKGTASLALLERLLDGAPGAVLYAGDDRTDEDAFRLLRREHPDAVTIRIAPADGEAPADTAAEYRLPDVESMAAFLNSLAAQVSSGR